MRIIFAGIIGRYPWGGVTWCSLMYLLGLRQLGHDVYYLEDTCECNYDPVKNTIALEPSYALEYLDRSLRPFGFGDRWCYVDHKGHHHGIDAHRFAEICKSADLFIVLSGGCWIWRDHYCSIPKKVFIDSDPAFTQLALENAIAESREDERARWYIEFIRGYDRHFTFGSNIGTPQSALPTAGFNWRPTWQPVDIDLWRPSHLPPRTCWTTVMTWRMESFTAIGGNKDQEFEKVLGLANRCRQELGLRFELAVDKPRALLREHAWPSIDAFSISCDLWRYRQYLSASRGEFSVAKNTYVATCSGWFSDRTACYLASGRPAVVQETGFSSTIPTGQGLFAWTNEQEAFSALHIIESHYEHHCQNARDLAAEYFSSRVVLPKLLEDIYS